MLYAIFITVLAKLTHITHIWPIYYDIYENIPTFIEFKQTSAHAFILPNVLNSIAGQSISSLRKVPIEILTEKCHIT